MAVLSAFVSLWDESGSVVTLAPGDVLPDWAVGRVGAHCLDGDAAPDPVPDEAPVPAEPEPIPEPDDNDAVPDFTGTTPAPRRGRPRKP
jgi:hypothetical protein